MIHSYREIITERTAEHSRVLHALAEDSVPGADALRGGQGPGGPVHRRGAARGRRRAGRHRGGLPQVQRAAPPLQGAPHQRVGGRDVPRGHGAPEPPLRRPRRAICTRPSTPSRRPGAAPNATSPEGSGSPPRPASGCASGSWTARRDPLLRAHREEQVEEAGEEVARRRGRRRAGPPGRGGTWSPPSPRCSCGVSLDGRALVLGHVVSVLSAVRVVRMRSGLCSRVCTNRNSTPPGAAAAIRCGVSESKCALSPGSSSWVASPRLSRSRAGQDVEPLLAGVDPDEVALRAVRDLDAQRLHGRGRGRRPAGRSSRRPRGGSARPARMTGPRSGGISPSSSETVVP